MFSFVGRWAENPPAAAIGKSLEEYLGEVLFLHPSPTNTIIDLNLVRVRNCAITMMPTTHTTDSERSIGALTTKKPTWALSSNSDGWPPTPLPIKCLRLKVPRNIGASITREQRDEAESELAVFRQWFDDNVLKPNPESLSDAILVLPSGKATPDYRDTPNG